MELREFFTKENRVAVAFSGGVDSAYLLYQAKNCGADVRAYYVKTVFQPAFELTDARKIAEQLGVQMTVLEADPLADPQIAANPKNRCYYCKKLIFSAITERAERDGCTLLLDGTNASDEVADRPGMRALAELSVRSPLRECGLTKSKIRVLSREAGLFTWDKPAYACLATRVPSGEPLNVEKLARTEQAEEFLASLGFADFRVRTVGDAAKIQVTSSQLDEVISHREEILGKLGDLYSAVTLDLEVRND